MRIIEKKIESIGNERIEIALVERTSRKWIAGIILLSIIVLGLYISWDSCMSILSMIGFRRLLTLVGGIVCMFMDLAIGEVFEMQKLSAGKNPVSRGAMNGKPRVRI